jgi:hypothetical protein
MVRGSIRRGPGSIMRKALIYVTRVARTAREHSRNVGNNSI